jgi:diguanylate cyclase (GGDEF)-like protein
MECEQAKRYEFPFSVMMIRVENYDKLANIYGTSSAENSMQNIAKTLQQNLRRSDIVGRYSKNAFVVLLPFTNSSGTEIVLSRTVEVLKSSAFPPCRNIRFSFSITSYTKGDQGFQDIIDRLIELLKPLI